MTDLVTVQHPTIVGASESIQILVPSGDLEDQVFSLAAVAEHVKIDSQEMAEIVNADLQSLKGLIKIAEASLDETLKPIRSLDKRTREYWKPVLDAGKKGEAAFKARLIAWQTEQERMRREAERAAREAAAREQERLRALARQAEEEARARADALRRQAEEADAQAAAALLAKAEAVEDQAFEQASELIEQAAMVPAQAVAVPPAPKLEGSSIREVWSAEVVDLMELVRAVVAGKVPLAAVEPNMKVLNAQAKSLKGQMDYPGVRSVCERTMASKGV